MGQVDLVLKRDGAFARVYVLKRLHAHFARDGATRAMFLEEARIAGLLRHANVVSVIDAGEDAEGPYLVMDYVDGIPLSDFLARAASDDELLPIEIVIDVVRQVAEGLRAAHELVGPGGVKSRVIHRDVSPSNVLLGFDGVVRVTDFGIARALGSSNESRGRILKGKPGYISPEQVNFQDIDERTDLYSLGVVLYELLASRRLYIGDTADVLLRIRDEAPPDIGEMRDDIPVELVELSFELLSKDPSERPENAREVARRLAAMLVEAQGMGDTISLAEYLEEHHTEEREALQAEISAALEDRDETQLATSLPDFSEIHERTTDLKTEPIPPTVVTPAQPPVAKDSPLAPAPTPRTRNLGVYLAGSVLMAAAIGVAAFVAIGDAASSNDTPDTDLVEAGPDSPAVPVVPVGVNVTAPDADMDDVEAETGPGPTAMMVRMFRMRPRMMDMETPPPDDPNMANTWDWEE